MTQKEALGKSERECSNCSELKTAVAVLQESILTLREEMLQQKAISDLIVSTPPTSNQKLIPILDNQNRLRTDLNLLRETIDEQNKTLNLLADRKGQPHPAHKPELADRIEMMEKTYTSNKTRIETLEINQENLKKAIKSVATNAENHLATSARDLNGELNEAFQTLFPPRIGEESRPLK